MEPLIEHSMELAGHRTRVLELEGFGPGIVLLHGWGDSADTWRPLLAELALCGRRAIAVDLPGFGSATRLNKGAILPQLDEFATALVREWGAGEPVVIAGNSLGGAVALRLAEQADELGLAGVVPVAPAGLERPGWFDIVERDPIIRKLLDIPVPVPGALIPRWSAAPTASSPIPTRRWRSSRSSTRSLRTTAQARMPPGCSTPAADCCPSWRPRRSTSPPSPAR